MSAPLFLPWADHGACVDTPTDWWFPESPRLVPEQARAVCAGCPVFADCHAHALRHEAHGVWASTSPRDREGLRRARGLRSLDPRAPAAGHRGEPA